MAMLPRHLRRYIFEFILSTRVYDDMVEGKSPYLYRESSSGHFFLCRYVLVMACDACGSSTCKSDWCGAMRDEDYEMKQVFLSNERETARLEFFLAITARTKKTCRCRQCHWLAL